MTKPLDTLSTTMAKETTVSIRVTEEQRRAIAEAAAFHGRSMSNYLLWIEQRYRKTAQLDNMYDNAQQNKG